MSGSHIPVMLDEVVAALAPRMDASVAGTAADLVNPIDELDLAEIIRRYGEERRAKQIARAIVAARPITRTAELAAVVDSVLGKGAQRIHPATRTFQALRIAVNNELEEIELGLDAAERMLVPEGRLAVVAFHSLEDRIVKQFLADRSGRKGRGSRHEPPRAEAIPTTFELLGKQPQLPSNNEIAANPRAR